MTIKPSPPGLQPEHYDEIEALLMTTGPGRAFLAEHARRARQSESARVLAAIERLEARLDALAPEFRNKAVSGVSEAPPTHRASPAPAARAEAASPAGDPRLSALSRLDSLPLVDRLALFA